MKATLDGQELTVPSPTLAAAIDAAAQQARQAGRIIIEVALDGRPLEGDELERLADDQHASADHVAITSADAASLVRVTLFDAADAMEHARDEHAACAAMIHKGQVAQAMEALAELLTTWQAVRQALIQGGAAVDRPLAGYLPDPATLGDRTDALSALLESLKQAVADDDLATVADLLEDDFTEEAQRWAQTLRTIAQAMRPAGTNEPPGEQPDNPARAESDDQAADPPAG